MAIKIVYYRETLDSFGRSESSMKPAIIAAVLKDPDNFTDDMMFEAEGGMIFAIDDLVGQEVQVGEEVIRVTDL
jgi:hypothetical protein